MRNIFLLACFILGGLAIFAQTKVLEIDVPSDSGDGALFGENRRHFVHFFVEGGLIADVVNPSGNYNFPKSFQAGFGLQYKLKITEWLSTGVDVLYDSYDYRLKDERPEVFPDTVIHDKEKLQQILLSGNYFIRFNMDTRGNVVGKYFDMGIGGGLQIGSRYLREDDLTNGEIREVKIRKYTATMPETWYVFGLLGVNNLALYGKYRLSSLFKATTSFPEAPAFAIGLRLGFH